MSPSAATNEATRKEWRELGFFYDVSSEGREWIFRGTRSGLLKFADLLDAYVLNPLHATLSEHDHYGPYMYLKIVTWLAPDINEHDIRGTIKDLSRLAKMVRESLEDGSAKDCVIQDKFAPAAKYSIHLIVESEDFDPASADLQLKKDG